MVKYYAVTGFFGVESDAIIGEEAAQRMIRDKEMPARSYREIDEATYREIRAKAQFADSILERCLGNKAVANFIETGNQHKTSRKR